jgi:hypothetical protein
MAEDLMRAVVWKNYVINGTDQCALRQTAEGWLLKGTVVGVLEDLRPMWRTTKFIAMRTGSRSECKWSGQSKSSGQKATCRSMAG